MASTNAFFEAVQSGDLEPVRVWLHEEPALRHARHDTGASALLWAVYHGQQAVANELLRQDAETDLFEATALGDLDRVAALLDAQPQAVNRHAPDGFAPLGLAAFFGHDAVLAALLAHGADANTPSRNAMQVRPLHSAAAHRRPEVALSMARRLLEAGAEVNVAQQGGWTPLHQAAAHGHAALVDLLLAHGADPDARSDDARTPADMARANGFADLADHLTPTPA